MIGKSFLVVGASGLIGSNLVSAIGSAGGTVHSVSKSRLPNAKAWSALPKSDYIIHAAGYASPALFTAQPMETAFVNTTGLMTLLDRLNPNGRLLFLSSSEVCSGSRNTIHREDDIGTTSPQSPRGIYIESKRCGEAICHAARSTGIHAVVARVSLAYGPGYRLGDRRVMSEFIDSALSRNVIEPKDGGEARRTYCFISDTVEMLLNILLRGTSPVYNAGGKSETTIYGLAQRIARLTRSQVKTSYLKRIGESLAGAPNHVGLDMARYEREFGPRKYVDWDEGLKRTIEWHRQLLGLKAA